VVIVPHQKEATNWGGRCLTREITWEGETPGSGKGQEEKDFSRKGNIRKKKSIESEEEGN